MPPLSRRRCRFFDELPASDPGARDAPRHPLHAPPAAGDRGSGFTGYDTPSETGKRAGTNIVDGVLGGDVRVSDFDSGSRFDNVTGSSRATAMEYLIAPGDSGGGLFLYDAALRDWALAGINSYGFSFDGAADSNDGDLNRSSVAVRRWWWQR